MRLTPMKQTDPDASHRWHVVVVARQSGGFVDKSCGPACLLRIGGTARGQRGGVDHRLTPLARVLPTSPPDRPPAPLKSKRTTKEGGVMVPPCQIRLR